MFPTSFYELDYNTDIRTKNNLHKYLACIMNIKSKFLSKYDQRESIVLLFLKPLWWRWTYHENGWYFNVRKAVTVTHSIHKE